MKNSGFRVSMVFWMEGYQEYQEYRWAHTFGYPVGDITHIIYKMP